NCGGRKRRKHRNAPLMNSTFLESTTQSRITSAKPATIKSCRDLNSRDPVRSPAWLGRSLSWSRQLAIRPTKAPDLKYRSWVFKLWNALKNSGVPSNVQGTNAISQCAGLSFDRAKQPRLETSALDLLSLRDRV